MPPSVSTSLEAGTSRRHCAVCLLLSPPHPTWDCARKSRLRWRRSVFRVDSRMGKETQVSQTIIDRHHNILLPYSALARASRYRYPDGRKFYRCPLLPTPLCVRRYALLRSDLSKKSATSRRCHPTNTAALTLGEQNEIVLRGYLGYSADRLFQSVRVLHRGER